MKELIQEKLREIEQREECRILLAVESGSRAWGFASPDSDYDVRFIYVRPEKAYLRLDRTRDVIEVPINDELDINGWDIDKTLRLLHKSNPTVFEWFSSPIIYQTSALADQFRPIMQKYFSSKAGLWHYLHMAEHRCKNSFKRSGALGRRKGKSNYCKAKDRCCFRRRSLYSYFRMGKENAIGVCSQRMGSCNT